MKKIFNVFLALVLAGMMFAVLPVDSADAGGCIYPEQIATGAYYVYDPLAEPGMYEVCEVSNPGSVPGYMNIDDPFDSCVYPDQVDTGEYYVYTIEEQPELYALCGLYNPGSAPSYRIKNQFERLAKWVSN